MEVLGQEKPRDSRGMPSINLLLAQTEGFKAYLHSWESGATRRWIWFIERFSIECRENRAKLITTVNQKEEKYL